MKDYKVYYHFKVYSNSPERRGDRQIQAKNKWEAIAKVQTLYANYYNTVSIIKVKEICDKAFWIQGERTILTGKVVNCYTCSNCDFMVSIPQPFCLNCAASMSIYKEV